MKKVEAISQGIDVINKDFDKYGSGERLAINNISNVNVIMPNIVKLNFIVAPQGIEPQYKH